MSDIPPKQPVSGTASARVESACGLPPLPHADQPPDIDATGALISLHQAATQSGPDSFPVLKAFQEYLESERQRARRRVTLITSLFAGIIVVLVAAFLAAGILLFNYMKEREERLWLRLETPLTAPPPVLAAPAADKPSALEQELRQLGEALADLKHDNEKLRAKFAATSARPSSPAARAPVATATPSATPATAGQQRSAADTVAPAKAAASTPTTQQPATAPAPAPVAAAPKPASLEIPPDVKPPRPPESYADSHIYLQPGGQGGPIPWRVYVPAP
jgi:hypothetical protein